MNPLSRYKIIQKQNWRNYQARLKKKAARKRIMRKSFKYTGIIFVLLTVYQIIGGPGEAVYYHEQMTSQKMNAGSPASVSSAPLPPDTQTSALGTQHSALSTQLPFNPEKPISKKEVQALIASQSFINLNDKRFDITFKNYRFSVHTTINMPLQRFILENMDISNARYIGIVIMEPGSGRILAMSGFDKTNLYNNPCTEGQFPAASIFKIITAAAAIERCGLDADAEIEYTGRKHTLYKSQIRKQTKRKINTITLQDSFAQSVNPVFGKLGVHHLGKTALEEYADAFGFNHEIPFEIPLSASVFSSTDDAYHLAEIASGFNRETTISPIHGALIVSAILNHGMFISPTIIDRITDENGRTLYQNRSMLINRAIAPRSSHIINELMKATITSGTCKRTFKDYQDDPILSKLHIGGKTGTINSKSENPCHYDWFVGFAEEKGGTEKIAISVCVGHEKYIGIKAKQYARMVMKEYFTAYLEKKMIGNK